MNYDRKRHIQLLNEQKEKVRSDELRKSHLVLIYQLNWETREQYITSLENYIKNRVQNYELELSFRKLYFSVAKIANLLGEE